MVLHSDIVIEFLLTFNRFSLFSFLSIGLCTESVFCTVLAHTCLQASETLGLKFFTLDF